MVEDTFTVENTEQRYRDFVKNLEQFSKSRSRGGDYRRLVEGIETAVL